MKKTIEINITPTYDGVFQEILDEMNNVKGEVSYTVPVENINVNPDTLRDTLVKMSMSVTNMKCPDCGNPLRFDHETECEEILYCIYCDHKIKAKKG